MEATVYSVQDTSNITRIDYNQPENDNNNYNNTRARARVIRDRAFTQSRADCDSRVLPLVGEYIQDAYQDVFRRAVPKCIARYMVDTMDRYGVDSGLFVAAIEYTAGAPRPSWSYARYMVELAISRGCTNAAAFHKQFYRGGLDDLPY